MPDQQATTATLPVAYEPAPGLRGYRTTVPPPEGCVGWGPDAIASRDAREAQRHATEQVSTTTENKTSAESPEEAPCSQDVAATLPETGEAPDTEAAGESQATTVPADAMPSDNKDSVEVPADTTAQLSPSHRGPLQDDEHLKALVSSDLEVMQKHDEQLKEILETDKLLLKDPSSDRVLELYRKTMFGLEAGPEVVSAAFHAVMQDDVEALRVLMNSGALPNDVRNRGGQSLLEVACERKKPLVEQFLLEGQKTMQSAAEAGEASEEVTASQGPDSQGGTGEDMSGATEEQSAVEKTSEELTGK
eukprot:gnl/TRDRNA2_/TRDRNA2_191879_c0_seq1.p1 gnl/TRDRNA2_/TRDRNA2_191879_c0~~gnl/TRDRNA2_/TRDRNA2_191879_c0_seq1.p1  ORF type:complete len:305 (+),score=75.30 gnl/TRDRNA2_/TRDRNA2_191879_c0_seq1:53-967(+)